jgi:hypothetical protein
MNSTGYSREFYEYMASQFAALATNSDVVEVDANLLVVAADLFSDVATRAPDHKTWWAEREARQIGS